jgi:hypothetical protein
MKFCHSCAYKANGTCCAAMPLSFGQYLGIQRLRVWCLTACAMCGKAVAEDKSTSKAAVVQGQKFSAK